MSARGDAVRDAVELLIEPAPPPIPIPRSLRDVFATLGTNREIAGELGVTPRTVQRYRMFATGGAGESRNPDARGAKGAGAALRKAARRVRDKAMRDQRKTFSLSARTAAMVRRMRAVGVVVVTVSADMLVSSDSRTRDIDKREHIKPPRVDPFAREVEAQSWDNAALELANAWGHAYGIGYGVEWEGIEDLVLDWPRTGGAA